MRSPRAAQGNSRARSASTSYVTMRLDARSWLAQFRWSVVRLSFPAAMCPEVLPGVPPHPLLQHGGEAGDGDVDVGLEVASGLHRHLFEMQDELAVRLARREHVDERRAKTQREHRRAAWRARRPAEERHVRGGTKPCLVGKEADAIA